MSDSLLDIGNGTKISYNTKRGAEIYRRSMTILLQCAIYELYPDLKVRIGQSLMKGYFFDLPQDRPVPRGFTGKIARRMRGIVKKNLPLRKVRVTREEAMRLYRKAGRIDKLRSVACLKKKYINLVYLRRYFDFTLTECVSGTGYLCTFKIIRYKHGFILQFPEYGNIDRLPLKADRQEKLYSIHVEAKNWNRILGVRHVYDLNRAVEDGTISMLIKIQEAFHEKKIGLIADRIKKTFPYKKIIIVAGPSASGKTTFIKRLGIQIRATGLVPEEISLDNYFVPRDKTPKTKDGECDYECPRAIDLNLFTSHVKKLLAGGQVTVPKYNFITGKREYGNKKLRLGHNSVMIVEGIHGLNPILLSQIDDRSKYRIFVSALTQLCIDNDTRIFTSDSRLMRRIVRDSLFRGYSAMETIHRFPKVRQGEDQYIFPFQDRADIVFNSSLLYEQAVLKPMITRRLKGIGKEEKEYYEAQRLLSYLDFFQSISADEVPQTSILREFIGESGFEY
ncbi:MAG: nucleoside kinase [Elusimicrobia bacterium]|nr:nucleoside kinase [Elusimicrobiota bacterium]